MFNKISLFLRRAFFERDFNMVDLLFVLFALKFGPWVFIGLWMVWMIFISPALSRVFWPYKSKTIAGQDEPKNTAGE